MQTKNKIVEQMMSDKEITELLRDTRDSVKNVSEKVDTLYTKMFVGNGQRSFDARMTLVENNQLNCPARLLSNVDSKALKVSYLMVVFSICALVVSLISIFAGK